MPASLLNAQQPPNILFLISDDHSSPDLGCYGNKEVRTPNLDRLAKDGARYTNCFVTSPQCSPNRSAIFTGKFAHTTATSRLHTPMPPWQPSFLEVLKQRGYHTGAFRKVHQGDDFNKRFDWYGAGQPFAKFFDDKPKAKPFFLHVGFTDPHRPYTPGAFIPVTNPAKIVIPEWLPDSPEIRQDLALYYDAIARMDRDAGSVLKLLEERGLVSNTFAVFTADNGMPFPPRAKGTLYDSGIRVPLIARWPGHIKPSQVEDRLVSHVDLSTTWQQATGDGVPGYSLLGTGVRTEIYSERNWHDNFDLARCVRTATHKLIFNGIPAHPHRPISDLAESMTWTSYLKLAREGKLEPKFMTALAPTRPLLELYDLIRDPNERKNVAGQPEQATVERDLLERLTKWMNDTYDFLPPPFRTFKGSQRPTL
ncbi:MAG: sulfatase [Bryobacteraceae bacterium]